ncbi:MAG: M48 family metalloprotease [Nitrospirae bacterium]|nr:M48 family metalloprotease [Nitrospirota bacterium]
MKLTKLFKIAFPIFLLFLTGCATTYNPATGKEETSMYSREKEIAIGQAMAKKLEKKYKISKEKAQYVEWIGRRVAFASDRIALPYSFKILDRKDLNALALPGGPVYVTKALVDKVNEDELAVVLGHEIAHITARHGVKRLQAYKLYTLLTVALMAKKGTREAAKFTAQAINILSLAYSQEDELLADRLGTGYAYKAGFDPRAALTLLKKLQEEEKKRGSRRGWLSTHPLSSERIAALKEYLKTLPLKTNTLSPDSSDK